MGFVSHTSDRGQTLSTLRLAIAGSARQARRWVQTSQNTAAVPAIVIAAYLALVPLLYLLWSTFYDGQALTFRFIRQAYSAISISEPLSNTLIFAVGSTALAVLIGTFLSFLIVRTNVPLKRFVFISSIAPLIIPGILSTIAWIFIASPTIGILNKVLGALPGNLQFNIYSMYGMIIVQGLQNTPLAFLLMYAAFRNMDPSLEEAAQMSGAPLITVLRKITLPLMRPALFASTLVMIVLGLEAFEVPALLGNANGTWVFTTLIFQSLQNIPANYGNAAAYSLPIVILAMLGIYVQSRLTRRSRAFQTVSGKAYRPRQIDIAWWRWPAAIGSILFLLISTILPFVVLLYASTQSFYSVPSRAALRSMTWSNYSYTFTNDETVGAIKTSLLLGIGAATAVMVLAAVLSWITVRTKTRLRWIVDSLATLPLAIPGVVLGVALLFIYLRFPIAIYGTIWVMFIAYLTRFLPYGMRYASVSMQQLSLELEESAHVSGASWVKTFARITAPLLAPGLVAGWIYILIVSLRELSTIILLYSPNDKTLSIVIWELWQNGQFTDVAALGVVMTVALVVLVGGAQWLGNRVGVAMGGRR